MYRIGGRRRRMDASLSGVAVGTVSYTHLDVYKRQVYTPDMVLGPARKGIKVTYCTDSRPLEHIVEAVSYTHLDVYKRQIPQ